MGSSTNYRSNPPIKYKLKILEENFDINNHFISSVPIIIVFSFPTAVISMCMSPNDPQITFCKPFL